MNRDDNEVKVFVRKDLHEISKTDTILRNVIEDFRAYKQGARLQVFGRDAALTRPRPAAEMAELFHAHVLRNPKSQLIEMARLKNPYRRTSDRFLIYTRGFFNSKHYYVLDYLNDNAHKKVDDMTYMHWLIDEAESFRKKM